MARGVLELLEEINSQGTTIIMVTTIWNWPAARAAMRTSSTVRWWIWPSRFRPDFGVDKLRAVA